MKRLTFIVVAGVIALSPPSFAQPQDAPVPGQQTTLRRAEKEPQETFDALMVALKDGNHEAFSAPLDDYTKARLTKPAFDLIVSQVSPSLKKGYEVDYLGFLRAKRGYTTHMWKITFKGDDSDILTQFSLKDGKVGGFSLKG